MIDIFNRKLYAYLLKNKDKNSILDALTKFFRTHHPEIIISDNDPPNDGVMTYVIISAFSAVLRTH